jgi:hypothetical protein
MGEAHPGRDDRLTATTSLPTPAPGTRLARGRPSRHPARGTLAHPSARETCRVGTATLYGLGTLIVGLIVGIVLVGFGLILLGTVAIGAAFVAALSVWIVKATSI